MSLVSYNFIQLSVLSYVLGLTFDQLNGCSEVSVISYFLVTIHNKESKQNASIVLLLSLDCPYLSQKIEVDKTIETSE